MLVESWGLAQTSFALAGNDNGVQRGGDHRTVGNYGFSYNVKL